MRVKLLRQPTRIYFILAQILSYRPQLEVCKTYITSDYDHHRRRRDFRVELVDEPR